VSGEPAKAPRSASRGASGASGSRPAERPVSLKLERLVKHLAQIDQGGEHDLWETADLTWDFIADALPMSTGQGRSAGTPRTSEVSFRSEAAREAAREVTGRLRSDGVLVDGREASERTLLEWAETASIWPPDERVEAASFYAHRALNPPKYGGTRRTRLLRLQAKSATGRVTEPQVRQWIRDRKPGEKQTFLEKVERRLRSAVKSAAAPWEATEHDDRMKIAKILREIAGEIERGEFR
jgi:hypothetical protein